MEFIKKNYEKIVLVAVLVILTIAACSLPLIISAKRSALAAKIVQNKPIVKELPPQDMSFLDAAVQLAQGPARLDYTNRHNLFNPVIWKKLGDGTLHKEGTGRGEGAESLEVTEIKPLYLQISYGSTSANGYFISIERQAQLSEGKRKTQNFVSRESKGELISLKEIKGPQDRPTELTLELNETGEQIVITPTKPFKRIEGYSADLKYPLEPGKVWNDRRVGSKALYFAGGYYNIVAITESNVVVLAESNKKKTTITFHPANETR